MESTENLGARHKVVVTSDALRQIRGGHPWVYDNSIVELSSDAQPGDLGVVFDKKRAFVGIGLLDPTSPIVLNMLHVGKPHQIDDAFFRERIDTAYGLRRDLVQDPNTNAFRVINGENDGLGGIVADLYAQTLVLKVYSIGWQARLAFIVETLQRVTGAERVVVRWARNASRLLGDAPHTFTAVGEKHPRVVDIVENGVHFGVDVYDGHKTGFFLDQRDNRARIGAISRGANMLDVFSYNGGFAMSAAVGGARSVHVIDVSPSAIASAASNYSRNVEAGTIAKACFFESTVGDAFDAMAKLNRDGHTFDVVVVDPPAFSARNEHGERAHKRYGELIELALPLVGPDGSLLVSSCSARFSLEHLCGSVKHALATQQRIGALTTFGHGVDHPVTFPQGQYLCSVLVEC